MEETAAVMKGKMALKLATTVFLLLALLLSCGKTNNSRPESAMQDITLLRNTTEIPTACQLAFASLSGDKRFEMANPGERYQETDVILEHGLPWRRLILAAVTQDRCAIEYEKGGRGKSTHLAVFDISKQPATFVWGGPGAAEPNNVTLLREKLAANPPKDPQPLFQQYW